MVQWVIGAVEDILVLVGGERPGEIHHLRLIPNGLVDRRRIGRLVYLNEALRQFLREDHIGVGNNGKGDGHRLPIGVDEGLFIADIAFELRQTVPGQRREFFKQIVIRP